MQNNHDGRRVRFIRDQLGLNQAQFAKFIGVSVQSVNTWENNKTPLSLHGARLIKAKTDYGLDFLIDGDTASFSASQRIAWSDWLERASST